MATEYSDDPSVINIGAMLLPMAVVLTECGNLECISIHLVVSCELCESPGVLLRDNQDLYDYANAHTQMCIEVYEDRYTDWRRRRTLSVELYSGFTKEKKT